MFAFGLTHNINDKENVFTKYLEKTTDFQNIIDIHNYANELRTSVELMYSSALHSSEKMESQHYN